MSERERPNKPRNLMPGEQIILSMRESNDMERMLEASSNPEINKPKVLGVADLIRYFVAGQVHVNPEISSEDVQKNIANEFNLEQERVGVYGGPMFFNIVLGEQARFELSQRFEGVPYQSIKDPIGDFRNHPFWDNY